METKENLQKIIQEAEEAKKLQDSIIENAKKELQEVGKKKIRPNVGEEYAVIYGYSIGINIWKDDEVDNTIWNAGNGFFTEEEAKKELAKRQAIQRVKDYLIENDLLCTKEEENNRNISKFSVVYDFYVNIFYVSECVYQKHNSLFGLLNKNDGNFIKDNEADLKIILDIE